jgi:hypothetical protein
MGGHFFCLPGASKKPGYATGLWHSCFIWFFSLFIQMPCFQFFIHNCLTGCEYNFLTSVVDEELLLKSRLYSLGTVDC